MKPLFFVLIDSASLDFEALAWCCMLTVCLRS